MLIAFRGQPGTRSFGAPTSGVPSANEVFTLSDGASLVLTVAQDADRTGRIYPHLAPIPPDDDTGSTLASPANSANDPLKAAQEWLAEQPACRS